MPGFSDVTPENLIKPPPEMLMLEIQKLRERLARLTAFLLKIYGG